MPLTIILLLTILLAACSPASSPTPETPESPQLIGDVRISEPTVGTLIYNEVIHISGTASGLPGDRFTLTLTAAGEDELARTRVTVQDDHWQIDLLHGYADVPSEVVIGAYADDPAITDPYDLAIVVIGGLQYRPDGSYGHFTLETTTLGGDLMPVSGIASGLGDALLTVRLLSEAGDLVSEANVSLEDPSGLNEVAWTAELGRDNYVGPAQLEMSTPDGEVLDTMDVSVQAIAG